MNTVDMHAVIWALRRLDSGLYQKSPSNHKTTTLGEYVAEHELTPVWNEDAEINAAILAALIELVQPQLDKGELEPASLDFSPWQNASKASRHLRTLMEVLQKRQMDLVRKYNLAPMGDDPGITPERADEIAKAAVADGIAPHEMTGALEQAFLHLLNYGFVVQAIALRKEFRPEAYRSPAVFNAAAIPRDLANQAVEAAVRIIFEWIGDSHHTKGGLENANLLVKLGVLKQEDVDAKIKATILHNVEYGSGIKPELAPYAYLVAFAELASIRTDKIASIRKDLAKPEYSFGHSPSGAVAELKTLQVDEPEIDSDVKAGYLFLLAKNGHDDRDVERYRVLLKENAVTADEERDALTTFTDSLVKHPNLGKEWLAAVAKYKDYFRPGNYQKAVFAAAYRATYGYHACPEIAAQLKAANPDFPWEALDTLQVPCFYAGIDLRAAVTAQIKDGTERTLAHVLFDWLSPSLDRPDSVGSFLSFLKESCTLATGLGKAKPDALYAAICAQVERDQIAEGSTTEEEIHQRKSADEEKEQARAQRVLAAFGGNLSGVPYTALIGLRQKVALAIRNASPDKAEKDVDFI